MASRKQIDFTIDEEGNVSIQVKGVAGAECEKLTREIEEALGVVSDRSRTSEYYIPTATTEKITLDDA